jgi:hypothetical protein
MKMGVQVTSARCVKMFRNCITPELNCRGTELSTIRLQQDAATVHTARSPNLFLSLCDYFPWVLERFQSKTLRMLVDAPWYVPNRGFQTDL